MNEQTKIGLLLAGPGVIATLVFTPLVITVFYSVQFQAAVEVLRWICLGAALRVITWPMGYIIIAKGEQTVFFLAELAWALVNVGLSWICIKSFGLNGVGIAFVGSYVFHGLLIYPIVWRISGFRWSTANNRGGMALLCSITVVFIGPYFLSPFAAMGLGALAVIIMSIYSLYVLYNLISREHIPHSMQYLILPVRFIKHLPRIQPWHRR